MLHVADKDIDAADIVHRAARGLDSGFQILANLPRLGLGIADADNGAVLAARQHAGDEEDAPLRLHHRRLREMAARACDPVGRDLLLGHVSLPPYAWRALPLIRLNHNSRATARAMPSVHHDTALVLLFEHVVGAAEKRERDLEAEGLGRLGVDEQLDFRHLLDRQISRLCALENAPGLNAGLTMGF